MCSNFKNIKLLAYTYKNINKKKTEQEKKNKPIIYANNKFFKYE